MESAIPSIDQIYLDNFYGLQAYAFSFVKEDVLAEDMVHNVFLKLMEKPFKLQQNSSLKSYLYRAVHNECINFLDRQKVRRLHQEQAVPDDVQPESGDTVDQKELKQLIFKAINSLPEQCRTVFQLSRFEELKYAEIAMELGISVKTVEKHMIKALKRLKIQLADYLPLLLWLFIKGIR
nr:RNA polymerase sigma-70 factor [Pedobacter sp. ASV19]